MNNAKDKEYTINSINVLKKKASKIQPFKFISADWRKK